MPPPPPQPPAAAPQRLQHQPQHHNNNNHYAYTNTNNNGSSSGGSSSSDTLTAILNNAGSHIYNSNTYNNNNNTATNVLFANYNGTVFNNISDSNDNNYGSSSVSPSCEGLDCYPPAFFNAVTVVTVCLAVLGGFGNALTVIAILTSRLRHNVNSILICNLSLADTIYCGALLPMQATAFYFRDWRLGAAMCELQGALRIWLIGVNMTLLSCIAFYRFLHVVHNNTHTYLSRARWLSLAVVLCWAFPFFFSFTPLVGWWGTFAFQDRILQCTFDTHSNRTHKLTVISLGYVIPCVFILVCYARIGCVVYSSRKRSSRGSIYRRQRAKRESFRLTAMMVFIFLGFLVGTTPFFLINTVDKSLHYPAPHIWSPVLAWFMYSLNPIIYTVMDAQFQAAYRRLLLCQGWKHGLGAGLGIGGGRGGIGGTPTSPNDMASYQERNSCSILKKPVVGIEEEEEEGEGEEDGGDGSGDTNMIEDGQVQ